ncbi:MAG: acyltransferase family protein [Bacillota bacterium]|nr:acyltransferase family protein [Bacillota bacterium]
MTIKKNKNRNIFLNLEKVIAAILVILIHCHLPGNIGGILTAIARSGVAFFFLISGYFTFGIHDTNANTVIKKRIKKIFIILIWSLIIYFLWESLLRYKGGGLPKMVDWWTKEVFTFHTLYKSIILDYDPLVGHLWFLFALIKSYILFWIIFKVNKNVMKQICVVTGILLFIIQFYFTLSIYRNGWFYGITFLLLGYLIAENKEIIISKMKNSYLFLIFVIGIIFTLFEFSIFGEQQIYIGNIFISVGAFILTLRVQPKEGKLVNYLNHIGEDLSMYMYIIHWAIIDVFSQIGRELNIFTESWYSWLTFILVSILSIIASEILFRFFSSFKRERRI